MNEKGTSLLVPIVMKPAALMRARDPAPAEELLGEAELHPDSNRARTAIILKKGRERFTEVPPLQDS
jgi:hypothetical protein